MSKNRIIILCVAILVALTAYMAISRDSQNDGNYEQLQAQDTISQAIEPVTEPSESSDEYVVDQADLIDPETLLQSEHDVDDLHQLTQQEVSDLLLMREEEKLARDVYQFLATKWGINIFSNIAASEQTHMDAMATLLDRYDLEDPVTSDDQGSFSAVNIAALYQELTQTGSQSPESALRVGAQIEDLDINDLQKAIEVTDRSDISTVYKNLQKGSRNHMRAFNKQLVRETGSSYEAQYISQEELDEILTGAQEKGNAR